VVVQLLDDVFSLQDMESHHLDGKWPSRCSLSTVGDVRFPETTFSDQLDASVPAVESSGPDDSLCFQRAGLWDLEGS
jgi:hypothetical protein